MLVTMHLLVLVSGIGVRAHRRRLESHLVLAAIWLGHSGQLVLDTASNDDVRAALRAVPASETVGELHGQVLFRSFSTPAAPMTDRRLAVV